MKIIAWNCNMAFRKKADFILSYKPDILIVPECEHPGKLKFNRNTPVPTDILWNGTNQNKGLGVFSYSKYKFRLLDIHDDRLKNIFANSCYRWLPGFYPLCNLGIQSTRQEL